MAFDHIHLATDKVWLQYVSSLTPPIPKRRPRIHSYMESPQLHRNVFLTTTGNYF